MHVKKIYTYDLEIYKQPTKYCFQEDSFKKCAPEILAQNEEYVVLNDHFFTKIEKKSKDSVNIYGVLNKPHIYFQDCLGQKGVFYTLYSTSKKRPSTIKKQIIDKAQQEYGYLFSEQLPLDILN